MTKRKNKTYDKDFKNSIVELFNAGKTLADLHDEYGVPKSTMRQWIITKKELPGSSKEESATMEDLLKLKKEIASLKEENEILKKAMTIFAKK